MDTAITPRSTATATRSLNARVISLSFAVWDRRDGSRRQVRPNGAFEIAGGLAEVAERAEVVQLPVEQHSFALEQRLKVPAVRLICNPRDLEGLLRLGQDRRAQQGGTVLRRLGVDV